MNQETGGFRFEDGLEIIFLEFGEISYFPRACPPTRRSMDYALIRPRYLSSDNFIKVQVVKFQINSETRGKWLKILRASSFL